ncbi:uncharacterized protein LY79DRAFT_388590 [Colletotrichum navitas]|uniref:Uncharacterized protein n=1 Tax=Colletotrichum navitas TaxID=681940 RepID=A0AAD8Q9Q1_9PEZI|nr:uncharacterized protein LY79DRAFT_388590 [Colletotrichum navitas]KAK1597508.1 hypothetical protein LY79DRAFT_388590 [Colletotrichum navitas]
MPAPISSRARSLSLLFHHNQVDPAITPAAMTKPNRHELDNLPVPAEQPNTGAGAVSSATAAAAAAPAAHAHAPEPQRAPLLHYHVPCAANIITPPASPPVPLEEDDSHSNFSATAVTGTAAATRPPSDDTCSLAQSQTGTAYSSRREYMDSLVPPSHDVFEKIAEVQRTREEEFKKNKSKLRSMQTQHLHDHFHSPRHSQDGHKDGADPTELPRVPRAARDAGPEPGPLDEMGIGHQRAAVPRAQPPARKELRQRGRAGRRQRRPAQRALEGPGGRHERPGDGARELEEGGDDRAARGPRRPRVRLRLVRVVVGRRGDARAPGREEEAPRGGRRAAEEGLQDDGVAVLPRDGRPQAPVRQQPARVPRGVEEDGHERELLLLAGLRRRTQRRDGGVPARPPREGAGAVSVARGETVLPGTGGRRGAAVLGQERRAHRHDRGVQGQHPRHRARRRPDARLVAEQAATAFRLGQQRQRWRRRRQPVRVLGGVGAGGGPRGQVRDAGARRRDGGAQGVAHLGSDRLQQAAAQVGQEEHVDLCGGHELPAVRGDQGWAAVEPVAAERPLPPAGVQLPRLRAEPQGRRRRHLAREHLQVVRRAGRARGVRQDAPEGQADAGEGDAQEGQDRVARGGPPPRGGRAGQVRERGAGARGAREGGRGARGEPRGRPAHAEAEPRAAGAGGAEGVRGGAGVGAAGGGDDDGAGGRRRGTRSLDDPRGVADECLIFLTGYAKPPVTAAIAVAVMDLDVREGCLGWRVFFFFFFSLGVLSNR